VEEFLKQVCAPHFWPIVITIAVMIMLMASGVALGPMLKGVITALTKRLAGDSVEVNINPASAAGEEEMSKAHTICEGCELYKKCPMHEAEKQRSLANKEDIKEIKSEMTRIWEHHDQLKDQLREELRLGLESIAKLANENKDAIIANQGRILAKLEGMD
jgi:hypothetical protein